MHIDFTKYKRFFVFGCSITAYIWPTWADILSKEMPQAEFFNFGKQGSGNLAISARIAEVKTKFKFTDTDLVIVMWASLCREDRWISPAWRAHGNIFNQSFYSKEWVEEFADPTGYLIRDLALIELVNGYMQSEPCDFIQLASERITGEQDLKDELVKKIVATYSELINSIPHNFLDLQKNGKWTQTHSFYRQQDKNYELWTDCHPTPLDHFEYIKKLGINFTGKGESFAINSESSLRNSTSLEEIKKIFKEQDELISKCYRLLY